MWIRLMPNYPTPPARSERRRTRLGIYLGILATLLMASQAQALNCSSLQNPLFLAGSTALEPLYKAIGKRLATDPVNPMTLVYLRNGSCSGVSSLAQKQTTAFSYIDGTYDGVSDAPTCVNDFVGGVGIDVALSDVAYQSCTGTPLPATFGDFLGPVESMVFIVPRSSTQVAITAEEAYYLVGFGQFADVSPWRNENLYCMRTPGSGTQRLIAANVSVPASRWLGKQNSASADVITCMNSVSPVDAERSIGILGTEVYGSGTVRQNYKALAFRGFGQRLAYLPDSSPMTQDKQNVRDGRYLLFGPAHMITSIDGTGTPLSSRASRFVNLLSAQTTDVNVLTSIIRSAKLVPQCAMHVSRTSDGGNLSLSAAATPCDCFFQATVSGMVPASCQACGVNADCPSTHCRFGYCETR